MSVIVVDSVLGYLPRLWEFGGRTGENLTESWVKEEVYIGARDRRFQVLAFLFYCINVGSRLLRKDSKPGVIEHVEIFYTWNSSQTVA